MAIDWAEKVKKYAPDADDAVIAGIVRYCGVALTRRDSRLVAFSDPKELASLRTRFLNKKLGRSEPDAELDAAIARVGAAMKASRFKNRVTVYYLLAAEFNALALFAPKAKADKRPVKGPATTPKAPGKFTTPAKQARSIAITAPVGAETAIAKTSGAAKGGLAVATEAAQGSIPATRPGDAARASAPAEVVAAPSTLAEPASTPMPSATLPRTRSAEPRAEEDGGIGWMLWLLLIALLAFALWWLFPRGPASSPNRLRLSASTMAGAASTDVGTMAEGDLASAQAEGSAAIPTGHPSGSSVPSTA